MAEIGAEQSGVHQEIAGSIVGEYDMHVGGVRHTGSKIGEALKLMIVPPQGS